MLVLAFVASISTPVHATSISDVFYVEHQGIAYDVDINSVTNYSASQLFNALYQGTAKNGNGENFSIPDLEKFVDDGVPMEFRKDSYSAEITSQVLINIALQLTANDTIVLQGKSLSSIQMMHDNGEVNVSQLPGGKPVTYTTMMSDLKDALVLSDNDSSVAVTGEGTAHLPNLTVAGIMLTWNGQELDDDVFYYNLIQMAGGEENLATTPLTVTWLEDEYQYVEISWSSMTVDLVYDYGEWDTENHVWIDSWSSVNDSNKSEIVIKNYSTDALQYDVSFRAEEGFDVSCEFSNAPQSGKLAGATDKATAEIPTATLALTCLVTDAPTENLATGYWQTAVIGWVTVTISETQ